MTEISHRIELLDDSVVKHFFALDDFFRELAVYKLGLEMTPRLEDHQDPDWIRMERVSGLPYLDCPLDSAVVSQLAETIASFHLSTWTGHNCLCHWDNQPRNILYGEGRFHLLDFAESRQARPEDDLTHLLLFWASEFSFSQMELLAPAFFAAYHKILPLNHDQWQISIAKSIQRFDLRRLHFKHAAQHVESTLLENNRRLLASLSVDLCISL